jgi:hypothetical protein
LQSSKTKNEFPVLFTELNGRHTMNASLLHLVLSQSLTSAPHFSSRCSLHLFSSRFSHFISPVVFNVPSEIRHSSFAHFLAPAIISESACLTISEALSTRQDFTDHAGDNCFVVDSCNFQSFQSTLAGGAISCLAAISLTVRGSTFHEITATGRGECVLFQGGTFDFTRNCLTTVRDSATSGISIIHSTTTDQQTVTLTTLLNCLAGSNAEPETEPRGLFVLSSGAIGVSHANITSCQTSLGSLLHLTPTSKFSIGQMTEVGNTAPFAHSIVTTATPAHGLDMFNFRQTSSSTFFAFQTGEFLVTRAWTYFSGPLAAGLAEGFSVEFAHCIFAPGAAVGAGVYLTDCETDYGSAQPSHYIEQLALGRCETHFHQITPAATWEIGSGTILQIAGVAAASALAGVLVFVGGYFGVKYGYRVYQMRRDRAFGLR